MEWTVRVAGWIGVGIFGIAGLRTGFGQAGGEAPQLRTRTERTIVVDGVVRLAGATTAGDFVLLDNGQRVTAGLRVVRVPDGEAQVIFVIDALNGTLEEVSRTEDALERWLAGQGSRLRHPTSILVVNAKGGHPSVSRTPATEDTAALVKALGAYRPGMPRIFEAQGTLGQADRVRLSLEALSAMANAEADRPGPKVVVWVGPGWPYLMDSSAKSSEQMFDSVVYFSDLLRAARMMVYAVSPAGVSGTQFPDSGFVGARDRSNVGSIAAPRVPMVAGDDYYQGFVKGVKGPKQADPNDLSLQVLAIQSGGLVLQHNNNLEAQMARCAADADALVTISFAPEPGTGVAKYHVLIGKNLRTRTGYYNR
jgi:VWFA-related protein